MNRISIIILGIIIFLWFSFANVVCESDASQLDWLYWSSNITWELIPWPKIDYSTKKTFWYYAPWLVPWYDYTQIKYDKIDIFLNAFVWPGTKWDLIHFDNFVSTGFIDMAHKKWKKVLLSVGWRGNSHNFTAILSDDVLRQKFLSSLIDFMNKYWYDWLDIDWEFPRSEEDGFRYMTFIKELRKTLWTKKILSAALPLSVKSYKIDLCRMERYLDYIFVMAYDVESGWNWYAWHNAPLYPNFRMPNRVWISSYINENYLPYIENKSKIILWFPLYGRQFEVWDIYEEKYMSIVVNYDEIPNNCEKIFDIQSKVPYLICQDWIITYDDELSFYLKRQYVKNNWFGWMFFWALWQDKNKLLDNISITGDMTQVLMWLSWNILNSWSLDILLSWYELSLDKWLTDILNKFFIELSYSKDRNYIVDKLDFLYDWVLQLLMTWNYKKYQKAFEYIIFKIVDQKQKLNLY